MLVRTNEINAIYKLNKANIERKYLKYPKVFLTDTCKVVVKGNQFLEQNSFTIKSNKRTLPRTIFLFAKENQDISILSTNFWCPIFLSTIEDGYLKSDPDNETVTMRIGLSNEYLGMNKGNKWTKDKIIKFIECLFHVIIEDVNQNISYLERVA